MEPVPTSGQPPKLTASPSLDAILKRSGLTDEQLRSVGVRPSNGQPAKQRPAPPPPTAGPAAKPRPPAKAAAPSPPRTAPAAAPVKQRPTPQPRRTAPTPAPPRREPPKPHAQPQSNAADSLPLNEHAERTILGALILDGDRLSEVSGLQSQDFYLDSHKRIFSAMLALGRAGQHIDAVTVPDQLAKMKGGVEACGGWAYLADLTTGVPRQAHITEYIGIVKEKARARRMLSLAEWITASIGGGEPTEETYARAVETLEAIGTDGAYGSGRIEPDLITLADVEARAVSWLWRPRIAVGMINELVGDTGVGKTTIALNVAAQGSRGRLPDGGTIEPFDTVYLTLENPIAEVLRPKFDQMDGDPRRFHVLVGTQYTTNGETRKGSITLSNVDQVKEAIRKHAATKLLCVDPVQSFYGEKIDWNHANQTRPLLDSLGKLADETRTAIWLLRHPTKATGGKATTKGLGSIDQTGAARISLLAGQLPDDPEARVLLCVKSNIGPMARALGYVIDGEGKLTWTGDSCITAAEVLAAPEGPDRKLTEATQWLAEKLRPGSVEQREIREQAEAAGIAYRTLVRAKAALNVVSRKASFGGGFFWFLPPNEPESGAVQ